MKQKMTTQQLQKPAHTLDKEVWSALSDTQKAKLLLGSERMSDVDIFLQEFTSLEQPEFINNSKVQATL